MIITAISDLHNRLDVLEAILHDAPGNDVIVFPGDLTHFGTAADAECIVKEAQRRSAYVFAVAGNCDNAGVEATLEAMGVSISGRGVRVGEVGFFGASGIPPWRGSMYCFSEKEILTRLEVGAAAIADCPLRIAVTHVPPYGTRLDRLWLGNHAGSHAVREIVETEQPMLLLCGHIHEAQGVERMGRTSVVNCGAAKAGHFARIEIDPSAAEPASIIHIEFRRV